MLRGSKAVVAIALAGCIAFERAASADSVEHSYQTWLAGTLRSDIAPRLRLYFEGNARFYSPTQDFALNQLLLRPAVGVKLAKDMYGWIGYAWTPSWNRERDFADEHRIWEQWSYELPLSDSCGLDFRTRIEQRFRPQASDEFAFRIRQRIRLTVPASTPLRFVFWDELMIGLGRAAMSMGDEWQHSGLDQNRAFLGVEYGLTAGTSVDCGYLNRSMPEQDQYEMVHILSINAQALFR